MNKTEKYLNSLFTSNNLAVTDKRKELFDAFVNNERNQELVKTILENQKTMVTDWKIKNRIEDIKQQAFMIPNGTVGKAYTTSIDFEKITGPTFRIMNYRDWKMLAV